MKKLTSYLVTSIAIIISILYITGIIRAFSSSRYDAVDIAASIVFPPYSWYIAGTFIYETRISDKLDYASIKKMNDVKLMEELEKTPKNLAGALVQSINLTYSLANETGIDYEKTKNKNEKLITQLQSQNSDFKYKLALSLALFQRMQSNLALEGIRYFDVAIKNNKFSIKFTPSEELLQLSKFLTNNIGLPKSYASEPIDLLIQKTEMLLGSDFKDKDGLLKIMLPMASGATSKKIDLIDAEIAKLIQSL